MAIALLSGTVKNYDWGGKNFIPTLLNTTNDEGKPFAEYWLGVHPQADCRVLVTGQEPIRLRDYISRDPKASLGEYVQQRFGNMPYLLKALDVKDMLSIQVHPTKSAAERDYATESKSGIAADDPKRNYKDDNHKPELMVAMGEFWLLHGFRPSAEMKDILSSVPELHFLQGSFHEDDYAALYRLVMEMPQEEVNEALAPLLGRIVPLFKEGKLSRSHPDYWAAKAHLHFSSPGRTDRGIFSIYLFNLVHLQRGEAVFQDAGIPHAYLEGQNVEIMASSDNVLRGGLTSKHIDVKELLKHVKCEPTHPRIIPAGAANSMSVYKTIAPDFELTGMEITSGTTMTLTPSTAEILLLTEGSVRVAQGDQHIGLHRGSPSAILFPGGKVELTAVEPSWVFRASVPVDK